MTDDPWAELAVRATARPRTPARLKTEPPANLIELAVGNALVATMDRGRWVELGLRTNTKDAIENHGRLLRALRWGDPDYEGAVRDVVPTVLGRRRMTPEWPWDDDTTAFDHLTTVARFLDLEEWLVENEPELHAQLYEVDDLALLDPATGAPQPPGWAALSDRVSGLAAELASSAGTDDFQDVGRRSREILKDCAGLLADPALLPPEGAPPKAGDAKAWLELFLTARLPGSSREDMRAFVRATWRLANTVTHADIGRVEAYAAAQATVLLVRTLRQLALSQSTK